MTALALFDFDHTVSTSDSFREFLAFAVGPVKLLLGAAVLSPLLLAARASAVPSGEAKEKVVKFFFKEWPYRNFAETARAFGRERLPQRIRPLALARIRWHAAQGHRVVIVTASVEEWLRDWCAGHGLDLIGTRLEVKNGYLTGRFSGENCNGAEKARRIEARYDLGRYRHIYAYGDSPGDREMLALADERYYRWRRV